MGRCFVAAALDAGHAVVATGRRPDELTQTFGARADLLACGSTSVDRFGRIDVLVNNAGASFKGFFEEMSPTQVKQQLATICWGR